MRPESAWSSSSVSGPPPPRPLVVYIDGPHSAPSSTIFSAEHAVLVATGIGVTPFASILQSIVARFRKRRSLGNLRQVDFIWVNRDYSSLDWFLLLLRDLEKCVARKASLQRIIKIKFVAGLCLITSSTFSCM